MTAPDTLTTEVLDFIDECITSVEELEILLLLWSTRERSWTPDEVSQELRTSTMSAEKRLKALTDSGLLAIPETGRYRFSPASPAREGSVGELAQAYRGFRVRVTERIYNKPNNLKSFADAFVIRKDKS